MSRSLAALAALALLVPAAARPVDLADTRLVSDPAASGALLAFAYANDLWVAGRDGAAVRRLTSHPGVESGPRFSPDGALVAFTGRYEGNTDVYVVPAAGGRAAGGSPGTPASDTPSASRPTARPCSSPRAREVYTNRYTQLFTVPVEGGFPTRLQIPNASKAAISPDGEDDRLRPARASRSRSGSTTGAARPSRILLFDVATPRP